MALILTPSLSQTHFCKSDNCGISKVTHNSDLICQILTLTLLSFMKILFTLIKFRNLYRVFKSFLSEISTAATVHWSKGALFEVHFLQIQAEKFIVYCYLLCGK
jgi:hypothetical protein